jgi:heptosyltransferase II
MFKILLKRSFYTLFKSYYSCRYLLVKKAALDKTWQKTDRIMLCAASGIGDAIMTLPVIAVLQQVKPNCRIGVVCRAPTQPLFTNMKIDLVLQYELSEKQLCAFFRLVKNIRHFSPHIWLALRPSNTLFHTALAIFSGAAAKIRHALPPGKKAPADMAFVYTYIHPFYPEKHQIQNNLNLIKCFQSNISAKPFLPLITLNDIACTRLLEKKEIVLGSKAVCIHAGGNQAEKQYPSHLYAKVINILIAKGYTILLLGGHADRKINQKIKDKITLKNYIDVSDQLELMQTAFVLSKSRALITNDSGIMHLADLLDVPLVALFSPTTPQHVGPVQSNAVTLKDPENIANIKVAEILDGFKKLTDCRITR